MVLIIFTILLLLIIEFNIQASAQVLAPNLSSCHLPVDLPPAETPFFCCAPLPPAGAPEPELYVIPETTIVKIRRPAHKLDAYETSRLARAYSLMNALPEDDPRSFVQQANIHCAYCNSAYDQQNSTELFQIHNSWLFFPFHRWYIYFHERILAKLLDDDTFALPYWNYDTPDGSPIPLPYVDVPVLSNAHRDSRHLPPAVLRIGYNYNAEDLTAEEVLAENADHMYRTLIRDADTPEKFFGMPYRHGDSPMPGSGTAEWMPHNTVHIWTGSPHEVGGKDMGSFYAAARDPIFYAHHAQLDRMWEIWKSLSPHHVDISDTDYLESEMAFYDENANLVRVRVAESLSAEKLGFAYEELDLPWLDAVPIRLSDGPASSDNITLCAIGTGKPLTEPCSVVLQRDEAAVGASAVDEALTLYDMQWIEELPVLTYVYLNWPSADVNTTVGCHEYVGDIRVVPQVFDSSLRRFNITTRVLELNLSGESSLVFTLVPHGLASGSPASFSEVVLEYPGATPLQRLAST